MSDVNTFSNHSSFLTKIESLKYFDRKWNLEKINSVEIKKNVTEIRENGFTRINDFVSINELDMLSNSFQEDLESARFEMPTLAQSKVDPCKHQALIDNYLRGNGAKYIEQGIGFDRDEFKSLDQVVEELRPSTLKSYYDPSSSLFFKTILNQKVRLILESYMGLKPYLVEAYTRRNFPAEFKVMNHHWHRDTNNKFFLLKAFLFLNDCTLKNGPHNYIKGSHKDLSLNGKVYYSNEEVEKNYDTKTDLILSEVKAGTLIIEDTRGLHRAGIPLEGHRDLMYGIFFPLKFTTQLKTSYYSIEKEVYKTLSPEEKSYIPNHSIT